MDLTILHTSDLHNRYHLFPLIKSYAKDDATLILDSGDALKGSNTIFFSREPILEVMGALGYDAMAVGNREFHYMRRVVRRRVEEASFPLLCANVDDERGLLGALWKPCLIKKIGDLRVAIVGLTPPQFTDGSRWAQLFRLRFHDDSWFLASIAKELEGKADFTILLSHLGLAHDKRLAESTDLFRIILGGHSHVALEHPIQVRDTYIMHSGSYGRFLGELKLNLTGEPPFRIEDIQWRLLPRQQEGR